MSTKNDTVVRLWGTVVVYHEFFIDRGKVMDTKRLLIADSSQMLAEDLTRRLSGTFEIMCCSDGYMAQRLLHSFQPHVVVLDLLMKGLDGIALMDWMNQTQTPPKILVTTTFMTPFVQRLMQRIPFDYLMQKPCDCGVLADRICELAHDSGRDIILSSGPGYTTSGMLNSLRVCANHKGFAYLKCGVELYQPDASMTKTVYPAIAQRFNARADAVERDIRRAISMAWEHCDPYTWRMYFESDRNGYVPRPTNTVFIATLARHLAMHSQKQA